MCQQHMIWARCGAKRVKFVCLFHISIRFIYLETVCPLQCAMCSGSGGYNSTLGPDDIVGRRSGKQRNRTDVSPNTWHGYILVWTTWLLRSVLLEGCERRSHSIGRVCWFCCRYSGYVDEYCWGISNVTRSEIRYRRVIYYWPVSDLYWCSIPSHIHLSAL